MAKPDFPPDRELCEVALAAKPDLVASVKEKVNSRQWWIFLLYEEEHPIYKEFLLSVLAVTRGRNRDRDLVLWPCLRERPSKGRTTDRLVIAFIRKTALPKRKLEAVLRKFEMLPAGTTVRLNSDIIPLSSGFKISLLNCLTVLDNVVLSSNPEDN